MERPQSPLELKVKAASLAAEARIIRRLELRLKRRQTASGKPRAGLRDPRNAEPFFKLQAHRRIDIRYEARATHLARTFLKGVPYGTAEQKTHCWPPLKRAGEIAAKYAVGDKRIVAQRWEQWKQEADAWASSHFVR